MNGFSSLWRPQSFNLQPFLPAVCDPIKLFCPRTLIQAPVSLDKTFPRSSLCRIWKHALSTLLRHCFEGSCSFVLSRKTYALSEHLQPIPHIWFLHQRPPCFCSPLIYSSTNLFWGTKTNILYCSNCCGSVHIVLTERMPPTYLLCYLSGCTV